jgi:hypothetical protein
MLRACCFEQEHPGRRVFFQQDIATRVDRRLGHRDHAEPSRLRRTSVIRSRLTESSLSDNPERLMTETRVFDEFLSKNSSLDRAPREQRLMAMAARHPWCRSGSHLLSHLSPDRLLFAHVRQISLYLFS